jgi:hypothetical protein
MASTKEYLEYILDQLSELEEITYRAMMGEYILLPACFLKQTIPHHPIAAQSLKNEDILQAICHLWWYNGS